MWAGRFRDRLYPAGSPLASRADQNSTAHCESAFWSRRSSGFLRHKVDLRETIFDFGRNHPIGNRSEDHLCVGCKNGRQKAANLFPNRVLIIKSNKKGPDTLCPAPIRLCNYLPSCLAISSAKFSCFFSMPSPFSKRMASLKVMEPPRALAEAAIYCSTLMLLSLTNSCCSRQFSA